MRSHENIEPAASANQQRRLPRVVASTLGLAALVAITALIAAFTDVSMAGAGAMTSGHRPAVGSGQPRLHEIGTAEGEIVFTRHAVVRGRGVTDLFTVRTDGTGLSRLTTTGNNLDPAWSPDGQKIALASSRPGRTGATEIYVIHRDTGVVRRLTRSWRRTNGYTVNRYPTWAPDGKTIVYSSTRIIKGRTTASTHALLRVGADGGTPVKLAVPAGATMPRFAADGSLYFSRLGQIYRLAGGSLSYVRSGTAPAARPDGSYLAYVVENEIFLTLGQGARKVADGSAPAWSPDGRHLLFAASDGLRTLTIGEGLSSTPITRPAARIRHDQPSWRPTKETR